MLAVIADGRGVGEVAAQFGVSRQSVHSWLGTDAGLGDSFSHAATAAGVAIMVSNSIGVKRPSAA